MIPRNRGSWLSGRSNGAPERVQDNRGEINIIQAQEVGGCSDGGAALHSERRLTAQE